MDEAMERIRSHQDTLDCHIGSEDVRKRLARNFFVHSTFALVFTSFYIVFGGQYSAHLSHRPWLILFCSARFCVVLSSSGGGRRRYLLLLQHIALAFELPFAICSGGSWYACTNTNFV